MGSGRLCRGCRGFCESPGRWTDVFSSITKLSGLLTSSDGGDYVGRSPKAITHTIRVSTTILLIIMNNLSCEEKLFVFYLKSNL
jgi:hypothetical protein